MEKLEVKKASRDAYDIYKYLKENCVGKENRTKVSKLRVKFNMDRRSMRAVLTEINNYMEFDKVVCRVGGVYIAKNNEELQHYVIAKTKTAMSILHEVSCIKKKGVLDKQTKIKLGEYYKSERECFEEE